MRGMVKGRNPVGICAALLLAAAGAFIPAPGESTLAREGDSATPTPVSGELELAAHAAATPTPPPTFSPATLRTAQAVFKKINGENWTAARRQAASSDDPLLMSLVQWLDLKRGSKHSFKEISAFITAHPGWPLLKTFTALAEEATAKVTSDTLVLEWFATHPPTTTTGRVRYGEALLREGREAE